MNKVNLEIVGLTYSESPTGAYVLILGDKNSQRRLPIVIGSAEAESIAVGLEKHRNGRPRTHDLFLKFAHEFGIEIMEAVICRFRDGVFYAMLICKQGDDLTLIDARPSDAIAIAVRAGCEIYAYESVMNEASIIMDDLEEKQDNEDSGTDSTSPINNINATDVSLGLLNLDTLEELLQDAIDNEDYQRAAQIRDEINNRK